MQAVAKINVGPISAKLTGRITLSEIDPPNGYRISGEGEGGIAGFAKDGAGDRICPDSPECVAAR
jgi:carbon monoxide dehydrogenase subunit G